MKSLPQRRKDAKVSQRQTTIGFSLRLRAFAVEGFKWLSSRQGGLDRALRHHRDQMRAVFGAGMSIGVELVRRHANLGDGLGREPFVELLLHLLDAEHA